VDTSVSLIAPYSFIHLNSIYDYLYLESKIWWLFGPVKLGHDPPKKPFGLDKKACEASLMRVDYPVRI
jgi:hypothetical protein